MKLLCLLAWQAILLSAFQVEAAVVAGPITNALNGHLYYLLSTNSWTKAEAEAVNLGGHLVTINDQAEQAWIIDNILPRAGTRRVWIGFTDQVAEGTFQWINGEMTTYRNWNVGEPNNSEVTQDYAHLYPGTEANPGKWNDVAETQAPNYYALAEITPGVTTPLSIFRAVEIAWPTQTTNRYQVQWSALENTNNWFNLGAPVPGTGLTNYYFDSTREAAKRVYRVRTVYP